LAEKEVHLATFHQGKIYTCTTFRCGTASCGAEPPASERLMPGIELTVAAFVDVFNATVPAKCQEVISLGFASFGCEPNTILTFLSILVVMVSLTILCGVACDQLLRKRVNIFVEASIKVTQPSRPKGEERPTLKELRSNIEEELAEALKRDTSSSTLSAPVRLGDLRAWRMTELPGSGRAGATDVSFSWLIEFRLRTKRSRGAEGAAEVRKFFMGLQWSAGPRWKDRPAIHVEVKPPMLVREVARLPGADILDAIEGGLSKCLDSLARYGKLPRKSNQDRRFQRLLGSKVVLKELMTVRAALLVIIHFFGNLVMVIVLPTIAWKRMTCEEGYPLMLNILWFGYIVVSNVLFLYLHLCAVRTKPLVRGLFENRLRIGVRFLATILGSTDIYQDATFPVISGVCGYDLWWVSFWLIFLGIGVMQVLFVAYLIFKSWRRYLKASTPEERNRHHIEGIFLALRATDNHVLVYLIKPAVEERLGGGSSWAMKSIEARVAFLRFVFEDAEQAALQVSFLYFFENATLHDKIWIGFSTATSVLHSFTLCVQTLPEVRDWLWNQVLAALPGGARFTGVKLLWLLVAIALYRGISIFPWLGACTPAGGFDDSALERLLLIKAIKTGMSPPTYVWSETLMGSGIAVVVGCVIMAMTLCIWRRTLRLPKCLSFSQHSDVAQPRDLKAVLEWSSKMSTKCEDDDDLWLNSLMAVHAVATGSEHEDLAVELLLIIDSSIVKVSRSTSVPDPDLVAAGRTSIKAHLSKLKALDLFLGPPGTLNTFKSKIDLALDYAELRADILTLLGDRSFRKSGLLRKSELIDKVTKMRAPLRMLHWSVLEKLGKLPKYGVDGGAEAVPAAITRTMENLKCLERQAEKSIILVYVSHSWLRPGHPASQEDVKAKTLVRFATWLMNKAKNKKMECEVFFWIDFCCIQSEDDEMEDLPGTSDIGVTALPMFVASSTHVLTWLTPDFDRRCWSMLERLLAYSFCPGGMAPFAVNEASFGLDAKNDASDAHFVVHIPEGGDLDATSDAPSAATQTPSPTSYGRPAYGRQVADEASSLAVLGATRVVRRARRLPDPLDTEVCRPLMPEAFFAQRRQVAHLVATALAIPALEIFADRQPVDFGRTEVVEQLIGPYEPVAFHRDSNDAPVGERWLVAATSQAPQREWRLVVELPGARPKATRLGDGEDAIVLVDRRSDSGDGAEAPSKEKVDSLFEAMDKAWGWRGPGGCDIAAAAVEKAAVALASALRAGARAAMESGDAAKLRGAVEQCRGAVELPEARLLCRLLCEAQLSSAMVAKDLDDIRMAIRFTRQQGYDYLEEFKEAIKEENLLHIEQQRAQRRTTLLDDSASDTDIALTIKVCRHSGWDDILSEFTTRLEDQIKKATDSDEGIQCMVRIKHLAFKHDFSSVVSAAEHAIAARIAADAARAALVRAAVAKGDAKELQRLKALGPALPRGWAAKDAADDATALLRKVLSPDSVKAKLQELVDMTFRGFSKKGRVSVTRDRRNPLATYLKVEEVLHIENAVNYLSFWAKRKEVAKEFKGLPDADKVAGDTWDIKSRRVSMAGCEGEEEVDPSINECWLWHGTSPDGANGITDTLFDMEKAGSAAGSMFGRGLYFAESCMKADEYTVSDSRGFSPMLLCRVVLGRINYCDSTNPYSIGHLLEASCARGGGYHAVLGDREKVSKTFREFIIFDNCQVYPEFLVWYSRVEPIRRP